MDDGRKGCPPVQVSVVIHGYASLAHYADHIQPILDALSDDLDGDMWSPSSRKPWGRSWGPETPSGGLWVVAGYADAVRLRGRPLVYVEHGAGQTYPGDMRSAGHGAFSGGDGLDHVRLFVCPSETVADRWRARYPDAAVAVVGCPKMDQWLGFTDRRLLSPRILDHPVGSKRGPVVAWTFHHENAQIPEQQSARTQYRHMIPAVRDAVADGGGILLGHGHPRNWENLRAMWRRYDVPCTAELGEVFDRADLLLVDNSSAGPEFASLGRPVVWLNAPWYRRDVDHGGRFWAWPQGQVQVDHPDDLVDAVRLALTDPPEIRTARERMVESIYAYTDGRSAERAAEAVVAAHAGLR